MENSQQDYLEKIIGKAVSASGIPLCRVCGERIVGVHVDYIDSNREPCKICVPCIFRALDFYLKERKDRLLGGGEP